MTTIDDYLGDKNKKIEDSEESEAETYKKLIEENKKLIKQEVNFDGFDGKLTYLVDGIRSIPNYQNIKGHVREYILPDNPGINAKKLSIKAGIHIGVALVILYDLYNDKLEEELKEIEDSENLNYHYV